MGFWFGWLTTRLYTDWIKDLLLNISSRNFGGWIHFNNFRFTCKPSRFLMMTIRDIEYEFMETIFWFFWIGIFEFLEGTCTRGLAEEGPKRKASARFSGRREEQTAGIWIEPVGRFGKIESEPKKSLMPHQSKSTASWQPSWCSHNIFPHKNKEKLTKPQAFKWHPTCSSHKCNVSSTMLLRLVPTLSRILPQSMLASSIQSWTLILRQFAPPRSTMKL